MDKYKPGYMGKVIPADDPAKLTDFVANKYESFSACYDAVKDKSDKINDVAPVPTKDGEKSFSMKVSTDSNTASEIQKGLENNSSVTMNGDTVTAKK